MEHYVAIKRTEPIHAAIRVTFQELGRVKEPVSKGYVLYGPLM